MKYIFITEFFESASLALRMKNLEEQDVKVFVTDKAHRKVLDGIIDKEDDYTKYLGQGNLFITDDASSGELADSLRAKGEMVYGGSVESDRLENERSYGQRIFRECGLDTVKSTNFTGKDAFEQALDHISGKNKIFCFKQNGDVDKSYNFVGKFENGDDMVSHILDMKKVWTENIDFDMMEKVTGYECAIEGFFNGKEFIRDTDGEELFVVNWEHKKRSVGDLGSTTGEVCTLQYRSNANTKLIKELKKVEPYLKKIKYIGNIDINFIITEDGVPHPLEWTNRFGYPSLNMHEEAIRSLFSDLLFGCATGKNDFLEYDPSWTVVICVTVPPFPFQSGKSESNAKGQRVYFLKDGEWDGKDHLSKSKLKHVHPYEIKYDQESRRYIATGDTGYLLTITASGDTVEEANENALAAIKANVITENMDYRTDCGVNERVTECIEFMAENEFL